MKNVNVHQLSKTTIVNNVNYDYDLCFCDRNQLAV